MCALPPHVTFECRPCLLLLLPWQEDGLVVSLREAKMTDPAVVAAFLSTTNVDALAVTIGNVHGPYAKEPPDELDWARLEAVRRATVDEGRCVPLVLHGASGLPPAMIRRAIEGGVSKFNVNTEVRAAAMAATRRKLLPPQVGTQPGGRPCGPDVLECMAASRAAMAAVVEGKMRLFSGK